MLCPKETVLRSWRGREAGGGRKGKGELWGRGEVGAGGCPVWGGLPPPSSFLSFPACLWLDREFLRIVSSMLLDPFNIWRKACVRCKCPHIDSPGHALSRPQGFKCRRCPSVDDSQIRPRSFRLPPQTSCCPSQHHRWSFLSCPLTATGGAADFTWKALLQANYPFRGHPSLWRLSPGMITAALRLASCLPP